MGTVLARMTVKDKNGKEWTGEQSMLVIGGHDEPVARVANLTLASLGHAVSGRHGAAGGPLPGQLGPGGKDEGPVWVTFTGAGLYGTQLWKLEGRTLVHTFPVEKRFGSAVYVSVAYPTSSGRWEERTVSFRIVPAERTLTVKLEPRRAEAAPLTEQVIDVRVTDHEGNGVCPALGGCGGQGRLRHPERVPPEGAGLLLPAGPQQRVQLLLRRVPGLRLRRGARAEDGGAAGPCLRLHQAAHAQGEGRGARHGLWEPNVVTDRDGRATVRFKLPSNQTLWVVTAVAADTSGRFGESTAEFATRGGLNLYAALPRFLRAGDEAPPRCACPRAWPPRAASSWTCGSPRRVCSSPQAQQKVELGEGGEQVIPLQLKATGPGAAELAVDVTGGKEPLKDRRAVPVRAALEEPVKVSAWGGGELSLQAAGSATVTDVELVLQPSVVDAALSNVRELLTYPVRVPGAARLHHGAQRGAVPDAQEGGRAGQARSGEPGAAGRGAQPRGAGHRPHPRPGGEGRRLHLVRWLQHARRGDDAHCPGRPGLRGGRGPGGRR